MSVQIVLPLVYSLLLLPALLGPLFWAARADGAYHDRQNRLHGLTTSQGGVGHTPEAF